MLSLSATTYDPNGALLLRGRISNPYQGQRRGSITATLDGGASVYDAGYSVSDQTLSLTLKYPGESMLIQLQYLVAYYGQVIATCETGAYSAVLTFAQRNELLTLQLRLISRLDA